MVHEMPLNWVSCILSGSSTGNGPQINGLAFLLCVTLFWEKGTMVLQDINIWKPCVRFPAKCCGSHRHTGYLEYNISRTALSLSDFSKNGVLQLWTKDTAEEKLLLLAAAEQIYQTKEAFNSPSVPHSHTKVQQTVYRNQKQWWNFIWLIL